MTVTGTGELKLALVNVLKFRTLSSFCSQIKKLVIRAGIYNVLVKQTGKTLIRPLLKKRSDLRLHCLSRPFRQATIAIEILEHLPYLQTHLEKFNSKTTPKELIQISLSVSQTICCVDYRTNQHKYSRCHALNSLHVFFSLLLNFF